MSRCFPFPPPGYEKKNRTDEVDLITKEKHRDKKPKEKEKKEKKRDGKEKKDKERSKEKKKERKDRDNEKKHKDKDNKKDKDRHKDKKNNSDDKSKKLVEKRLEGIPECYNGGKPYENSQRLAEIKDSNPVENAGRGSGDEERRNHLPAQTIIGTNKWKFEGTDRVVEKDFARKNEGYQEIDDRRKRVREEFMGKAMVEDITKSDRKSVEKDSNNGNRRVGGQIKVQAEGGIANPIVHNFPLLNHKRVDGILADKDVENGKEKNKRKASDDKHGDKNNKREKKSKGKDKGVDKEKEEEKQEKLKVIGDPNNSQQDKCIDNGQNHSDTLSIKPLQVPNNSSNGAATEGNVRKRKEHESNGFLHENEIRPNKLLKPAFSSHPFPVNGKKLEACRSATLCVSDGKPNNNIKADYKEHKVNGVIENEIRPNKLLKPAFSSHPFPVNGKKLEACQSATLCVSDGKPNNNIKADYKEHKVNGVIENEIRPNKLLKPAFSSHPFPVNGKKLEACQSATLCVSEGKPNNNIKADYKEHKVNGVVENEIRPNKLPKPAFSSHPFPVNGKKLEAGQSATLCVSDGKPTNNIKADYKDHKVNGVIEAQVFTENPTKSSIASLPISENGDAKSKKPPHPDTKYLNHILSIPTVEELFHVDDQDWLFRNDDAQSNKPEKKSADPDMRPHVWAKAVQINSADIYALPYVIPY